MGLEREGGREEGPSVILPLACRTPLTLSVSRYRSLSRPERSRLWRIARPLCAIFMACVRSLSLSLSLSLSRYMYFAIPLSTCPCTAYPGRSHAELRSGSRWARAVSGSALYSIPCFVSMHSKTLSKGGVLTAHHSVTNSSM